MEVTEIPPVATEEVCKIPLRDKEGNIVDYADRESLRTQRTNDSLTTLIHGQTDNMLCVSAPGQISLICWSDAKRECKPPL